MSDVIGTYEVLEPLGDGAFGELVLARGPDGERVVVKRLKVERIVDEKSLELFEREVGVLTSLRHRAVPRFIDSGVDSAGVPYLVQEHIPGPTLEQATHQGRRFDSAQAERLARDLLHALEYLHGLHPPVIHRDIKPANVVLDESRAGEGRPVLVDFGAVAGQALLPDESSDTVVGTFGYMAPEMLKGHASAASDLYALGATLLFAFTGREPESFPEERLRLRFRDALNVPDRLGDLLEALLEPAVEDRPASATAALRLLDGSASRALVRAGDGKGSGELTRDDPGDGELKRRTIAGLPAKPVVITTAVIAIGVLAFVFPPVRMAVIGTAIVAVLIVILLITLGGI